MTIRETIETLEKISKDWSDIEKVYSDLKDCANSIRTEILQGKDLFTIYDLIISQIALIELELEDEFDGRVFRGDVKKLKMLYLK